MKPAAGDAWSPVVKTSLLLSASSVLLGLAGAANQVVAAGLFGAGAEFDAYLLAVSIPLLAMGLGNAVVSHCFLPVLVREQSDPAFYGKLSSAFLIATGGVALLGSTVACLAAPTLMQGLLRPLPARLHQPAIAMSQIAWVTFGFMLWSASLTALHHSAKSFVPPALANFLPPLGMIAACLAGPRQWGPALLAWGMLGGALLGLLLLLAGAFRSTALGRPDRKAFALVAGASANLPLVMLSSLAFTAFGTVDAVVAARLGPGALSYLGYSQRILIALGNTVILGPALMLIPYLSEALAQGDSGRAGRYTRQSVLMVVLLSAPVALAVGVLRFPLLKIALERGAFRAPMTAGLAATLPWMLTGMVAMLASVIAFKAFYAHQDYRTPALLGATIVALYASLSFGLSRIWELEGICAAYALSWWFALAAALAALRRTSPGRPLMHWRLLHAARYLGCLLLTGVALWLMRELLISPLSQPSWPALAWRLSLATLVAATGFVALSTTWLHVPELSLFFNRLAAVLVRRNASQA